MKTNVYIYGVSPVHTCDARTKIILLFAYSIALFALSTWVGLIGAVVLFIAVVLMSGIGFSGIIRLATPVYILAAFAILFNAFTFDISNASVLQGGLGAVSAGVFEGAQPCVIWGSFGFTPAGCVRGCFYALRIVLLVYASLIVCFTTTQTALVDAFVCFLRPLRSFHVPVDDIAMTFSIALRFIPLTAEELSLVYNAQWARGAAFSGGSIFARLRAWTTVFMPLFVGLFRRADRLALSMEARCYGAPNAVRSTFRRVTFGVSDIFCLGIGLAVCVLLGVYF